MKKIIWWFILTIFSFGIFTKVNALTAYSSVYNTYYQRGQHTYAWHDLEGKQYTLFAPAIYIMYPNQEDAANEEEWNFYEKYKTPWSPTEKSYYLALCADLIYDFWPVKTYQIVDLANSTYIKDEIKDSLTGIIHHVYPYITEEEMLQELIEKKVMVETTNQKGEKIYTSPKNIQDGLEVEYTLNKDEILSAVQMAIYYFTDQDKVDELYYRTALLSTNFSVIDRSRVYEEAGYYDTVANNIDAIYHYLITLKEETYKQPTITKVVLNNKNELILTFSNEDIQDLKVVVKQSGTEIISKNVSELSKTLFNQYIVPLEKDVDSSKLEVSLVGTVHKENVVYAFEAEDGPTVSQTLLGEGPFDFTIQDVYQGTIPKVNITNLKFVKNVNKDLVSLGENLEYHIVLTNTGDIKMENIRLVDELNDNLELVETNGKVDGKQIIWDLSLEPKETKELTLLVKVKKTAKEMNLVNQATVEMYHMDIQASASTTILENPQTGLENTFIPLGFIGFIGIVIFLFIKKKQWLFHL